MGKLSFLLWLELSTLLVLLPWSLFNGEITSLQSWPYINSISNWSIVVAVSLLGGMRAFATTQVLRYSDPISLASANVIVQMATIVGSIVMFHTEMTTFLILGTVVSLGGFAAFTIAKISSMPRHVTDGSALIVDPDEATVMDEEGDGYGSGSLAEGKALVDKHGSKEMYLGGFAAKEYGTERVWSGFGPASEITFAEGETTKEYQPRMYTTILRILVIFHGVSGVMYLMWISQNATGALGDVIGPMFLIAEFTSFIMRLTCFTQYWTKVNKAVCPLHELSPEFPESEWPMVQFCVTHYKEPVGETYPTLKNLLEMDYPPEKLEINILDDGYFDRREGTWVPSESGRDMTTMVRTALESYARGSGISEFTWEAENSVRPETAEAGSLVIEFKHQFLPTVRQIARRRGAVSHFKGGNLNNAIFNVLNDERFQFFAFLDCDMVPTHDFLQLSLPLFLEYKDEQWQPDWVTGMSQAPQNFSNVASNGSDDPLSQIQDLYWRRTMMHLDKWGAVHYYGTNVLFFRPALEDTLGWQYGVLSEDTPTGANLIELGWKAVYLDQNIATGLCKDNVEETLIQRKRWAMGNVMWAMLTSSFGRFITTSEFQDPPFWDRQREHYARAKADAWAAFDEDDDGNGPAAETMGNPTRSVPRQNPNPDDNPEMNIEGATPLSNFFVPDSGLAIRQERMRNHLVNTMRIFSYAHVMYSNQVAAFWFVAYLATATYMMVMAGESSVTTEETISINVLPAALHFVTTTTILYVIGPQTGLWRSCQDRFAFAWVRIIGIYEACYMAMKKNPKMGSWNSKAGTILVVPPLCIYAAVLAVWTWSTVLCVNDIGDCLEPVQSLSLYEAKVPVQLVGLFLGAVILITMWPITRSSLSNVFGYPMYKLRILPGGSTWPYLLATAPLILFVSMWALWGSPESVSAEITSSFGVTEMCIHNRVAPSLFVLGATRSATTSLFSDMTAHMSQINAGRAFESSSDSLNSLDDGVDDSSDYTKNKHFFDSTFNQGMPTYLKSYPTCSSRRRNLEEVVEWAGAVAVAAGEGATAAGETGRQQHRFVGPFQAGKSGDASDTADVSSSGRGSATVSADFTSTYLEARGTATRIRASYTGTQSSELRFVTVLRDPVDRLFSYFVAAKKAGTLDLTGYTDVDFSTMYDSLKFDDWAQFQLQRAGACMAKNPDQDLWPHCGTEGLFGSLYSKQLSSFAETFSPDQVYVVSFDSYTKNGPRTLSKLASSLGLDFETDGMTAAANTATDTVSTDVSEDSSEDQMGDATRKKLNRFFDPYRDELYSMLQMEGGVNYIDITEESEML